jgi:hypothetical protein
MSQGRQETAGRDTGGREAVIEATLDLAMGIPPGIISKAWQWRKVNPLAGTTGRRGRDKAAIHR